MRQEGSERQRELDCPIAFSEGLAAPAIAEVARVRAADIDAGSDRRDLALRDKIAKRATFHSAPNRYRTGSDE